MSEDNPIEPGEYDATIQTTEIKESPTDGHLTIEVTMTVEWEGKEEGIVGYIHLTERAAGINRSFFRAIGFDPDSDPTILHSDPLLLHNKKTRILVENKANRNGEMYARVGRFLQPKLQINELIKEKMAKASADLKAAKENRNG